jgi:hypothetical protein
MNQANRGKKIAHIFVIVLLILSCRNREEKVLRTNEFSEITIGAVKAFARENFSDKTSTISFVHYRDFDFGTMTPIDDPTMAETSVNVAMMGRDVIEIQMASSTSSFRFTVAENKSNHYYIIYPFYRINGYWEPVNGFILVYDDHCYFMRYDDDPQYFMTLDSHLNALETFRSFKLQTDSLVYRTVVNYKPEGYLYSETFYELKQRYLVTDRSTLDALINFFKTAKFTERTMELRIGMRKEHQRNPLWIESGHEEFDYDAIPNEEYLPLDFSRAKKN